MTKIITWLLTLFLHIRVVQLIRLILNVRTLYLTIEQCSRTLGRTREFDRAGRTICPDRKVSLDMCNRILNIGLYRASEENDKRFRERQNQHEP